MIQSQRNNTEDVVKLFNNKVEEVKKIGKYDPIRELNLSTAETIKIYKCDHKNLKYLLRVKNIPFEAWDIIIKICDEEHQSAIASKYPLLNSTYEFVSENGTPEAKANICGYKKTPKNIVEKIMREGDEFVIERIKLVHPDIYHTYEDKNNS